MITGVCAACWELLSTFNLITIGLSQRPDLVCMHKVAALRVISTTVVKGGTHAEVMHLCCVWCSQGMWGWGQPECSRHFKNTVYCTDFALVSGAFRWRTDSAATWVHVAPSMHTVTSWHAWGLGSDLRYMMGLAGWFVGSWTA